MVKFIKAFEGDSVRAQLMKGVGGSAGIKIINILLTLAVGILLARAMGPERYGIYAFALSVITLLGLPTKAGLPTLLVREISKGQLYNNWGMIKGILKLSGFFVVVYAVVIALVFFVFLWQWGDENNEKINTFMWATLLLPVVAFEGLRAGALRGLRWVVSSQLPEQVIKPFCIIVICLLALSIDIELTAAAAMQFNVASTIIAFIVGWYILKKALPSEVNKADSEYSLKPWACSLLPLSLFAGLKVVDSQVSVLFLGILGTPEEVGLLRVAATGAGLVAVGLTAVNMAIAPQIARLYDSGEIDKLQRIITLSTRGVAVVSFPLALIFIVWGEDVITIVFGAEYSGAAIPLAILCLGQLVNASSGSVALILNMTNNDKKTLKGIFYSLAINLFLSIILIPSFGVIGAAISSSLSLAFLNLWLVRKTYKYTGIKSFLSL